MDFFRVVIVALLIAVVACESTNERLGRMASEPTNARLSRSKRAAVCEAILADYINNTLSNLEKQAQTPRENDNGQMSVFLAWPIPQVQCHTSKNETMNLLGRFRAILCGPKHDLIVTCNSSAIMTDEQRNGFRNLTAVDHTLVFVSTHEENRIPCDCQ